MRHLHYVETAIEKAEEHSSALEKRIDQLERLVTTIQERTGLLNPDREGWKVVHKSRGNDGAILWRHLDDDTLYWEDWTGWGRDTGEKVGFHTYDKPEYIYPVDNTDEMSEKDKHIVRRVLKEFAKEEAKIPSVIWVVPEDLRTSQSDPLEPLCVALNHDRSKWYGPFILKESLEECRLEDWDSIDEEGVSYYFGKLWPDARAEKIRLAMLNGELGEPVMGVNPF